MQPQDFVHLHLHSEYSLSDGIIRIEDLIDRSSEYKFSAVALTDLTNLFGLVKFYRIAREKGIKPIVGCEIRLIKDEGSNGAPFVLLVKNKKGYTNLTKLVSKAYIEGQETGNPLVKIEWLADYSEGLIALSGGQNGHIGQALLLKNNNLAKKRIDYFKNIYGDDFFIEVQRIGREDEEQYNLSAVNLAEELAIPIVATNDVRFLRPIDPDDESPSDFEVPGEITTKEHLRKKATEGLKTRFNEISKSVNFYEIDEKIYMERLEYELDMICKLGFEGYFLIVADFVNWAQKNEIPVGPGRGSGAGSITAYALGITAIDPIKYDLLFERFLNPDRVSNPDFDIDFCMEGRD